MTTISENSLYSDNNNKNFLLASQVLYKSPCASYQDFALFSETFITEGWRSPGASCAGRQMDRESSCV